MNTDVKKDSVAIVAQSLSDDRVVSLLKNGSVAIIPTDTIYGIVGRADMPDTVMRIRQLKHRGNDQALIVLCADIDQVAQFGVDNRQLQAAAKHWPAKVSIVLDTQQSYPEITGGLRGIAFRIPQSPDLIRLLKQTGPLVAPSANPKDKEPATTLAEAQSYYENLVGAYVDGDTSDTKPSKLIKIYPDGTEEVLRG